MEEKYTKTPLVDQYLQSILNMKAAETDPFFYTRLNARMKKEATANQPQLNLKWVLAICTLTIFLSINCWILSHPYTPQKSKISNTAHQSFEDTYGIGNSLSY